MIQTWQKWGTLTPDTMATIGEFYPHSAKSHLSRTIIEHSKLWLKPNNIATPTHYEEIALTVKILWEDNPEQCTQMQGILE